MELKAPLDTQVEVTFGCNYHCGYCYNPFEHNPISMSDSQIERVVKELDCNDVFSLIFTGGEPFANRDILMKGLILAQERGRDTYVNTNLSVQLYNEEISVLKNVKNVLFSFPSSDPQKYSKITKSNGWKKVIRNLERLTAEGVILTANQVVTPFNKEEIYKTAQFLRDSFGLRNFCATPVNPSGCSRVQFNLSNEDYGNIARELLNIKNKLDIKVEMLTCLPVCLFPEDVRVSYLVQKGCSAGKSTSAIGANGDVRRCVETEKTYGNIFTESFSGIWKRIVSEEASNYDSCRDCSVQVGCNIGCEARAIKNNGVDPLVSKPILNYAQIRVPDLIDNSNYHLRRFMSREEKDGQYIITNGGSFLIPGNEAFVSFLEKLRGKLFTPEQVRSTLGEKGLGLINYLNSLGMVVKNEGN